MEKDKKGLTEAKNSVKTVLKSGITHHTTKSKVMLLTKLCLMIERIMKDAQLGIGQLELVLYTVMVYMEDSRSISQYEYTQRFSKGNSRIINCKRTKALVAKGYLEIVGISKYRSPLYIPTNKALQMVNKYFNGDDISIIFNSAA